MDITERSYKWNIMEMPVSTENYVLRVVHSEPWRREDCNIDETLWRLKSERNRYNALKTGAPVL